MNSSIVEMSSTSSAGLCPWSNNTLGRSVPHCISNALGFCLNNCISESIPADYNRKVLRASNK